MYAHPIFTQCPDINAWTLNPVNSNLLKNIFLTKDSTTDFNRKGRLILETEYLSKCQPIVNQALHGTGLDFEVIASKNFISFLTSEGDFSSLLILKVHWSESCILIGPCWD